MNEKEYVLFVIEDKCNNKCNICSVKGADGALVDLLTVSMVFLKKFLKVTPAGKYQGIIFSGGEPTLNKRLPEYASYARDNGFRNIMIQTNARALSDMRKAIQLKSAGINQFFVSFHAADNDLCDRIAGSPGAYFQTVKALENLDQLNLTVITNTVMSAMNYTVLPPIGRFLQKFSNIVEMQFWGYIPMSSKASELIVSYTSIAPYLNETIKYLVNHHKEICIKFFPVCLLDDPYKKYYKRGQPKIIGLKQNYKKRLESCDFQKCPGCRRTDCTGMPEMYKSITFREWTAFNKGQRHGNSVQK